ncbi:MAG: crossover junction endodeoxyribonuclease RuvC, partial [Desulfosalsimonas sp.]
MATFIGIDPGLAATGVAVITGSGTEANAYTYGVIRTDAGDPSPLRLNRIFEE